VAGGSSQIEWFNHYVAEPVGQIFLRLLFMVVIPLVFATLSLGVANLGDVRHLGRIGGLTFGYFVLTTALAAIIGLALANGLRPGDGLPPDVAAELVESYSGEASARLEASGAGTFGVDTFVNIVPRNPLRAAVEMEMLPVIFFSIMFGIALTLIASERAAPWLRLLEGLADVVTKLVELTMRFAPYGVFALIFVVTSRFGWSLLAQLGVFVGAVLLGLFLHCALTLSLALRFGAGLAPARFWIAARSALITAFSTSSSNATLPTSLLVAETKLNVPPRIAGFVVPLGATLNMNGTALFEGMTVLFVAQIFGVQLGIAEQAIVVVLCVMTAVGAAGVPGGSIPLLMVMATSVGVPGEGIAIILGVERFLDMSRTLVNVAGDLTAACVVARADGTWTADLVGKPPTPATSGDH
jgi:DAACS family dicarboxylate/amino acid:cation (Na+ or H+) symporter